MFDYFVVTIKFIQFYICVCVCCYVESHHSDSSSYLMKLIINNK